MRHVRFMVAGLCLLHAGAALAHGVSRVPDASGDRAIQFPDTAEHLTIVTDLHTHSVFSDGHVWPKIRVDEALRDGLDVLAITEHLEYQPHRADILHPDRNRAYEDALQAASASDLLVVLGSEITRDPPAGHINAVFLQDANQLVSVPSPPADQGDTSAYYQAAREWPAQNAVDAAAAQGAFLFWNHPFWSRQAPDGIARMNDFHRRNARRDKLHGIEIANGDAYSEEAFAIALRHDLAVIGVSDIHELIDWDYEPHNGGHRPVTLVFAEERSADSIREALFARRTVVWYKNLLIGREQDLRPLLEASLTVTGATRRSTSNMVEVTLVNRSDADFELRNLSDHTFMYDADRLTAKAHATTTLLVKPGKDVTRLRLSFEVQNALVAPKKHPRIRLDVENIEVVEAE